MVTVIGRGHSGTRAVAASLKKAGVYMGQPLNHAYDLQPPDEIYEACRVMNSRVRYLGNFEWDFSELHDSPIDPAFTRLMASYLSDVLESEADWRGWKMPETTLILPWIVRLLPDIKYIYLVRDPRDSILGFHVTDELASFGIPCEHIEDLRFRRAVSWKYQAELVKATPRPRHWHRVRFEDFVLRQDEALTGLQHFLGFRPAEIPSRKEAVGRWRKDEGVHHFDVFTPELLEYGYVKKPGELPTEPVISVRERIVERLKAAVGLYSNRY